MLLLHLAISAHAAPAQDPLLLAYDDVRVALVADRFDDAKREAADLFTSDVAPAARAFVASDDPHAAFGELSRALVAYYAAHGVPDGVHAFHCPMTSAWQYWLQPSGGIGNPYMGVSMPTCGEAVSFAAAAKKVTP